MKEGNNCQNIRQVIERKRLLLSGSGLHEVVVLMQVTEYIYQPMHDTRSASFRRSLIVDLRAKLSSLPERLVKMHEVFLVRPWMTTALRTSIPLPNLYQLILTRSTRFIGTLCRKVLRWPLSSRSQRMRVVLLEVDGFGSRKHIMSFARA